MQHPRNSLVWLCWLLLGLLVRVQAAIHTNLLQQGHVDIRVQWDPAAAATNSPNALSLAFHADDLGRTFSPEDHAVQVPESARLEIPDGFEVFGAPGASLWILPQSLTPGLVYLGFSAEGLPRDTFTGELAIRLLGFDGPGDFFLWQADGLGSIQVLLNSRDGIGESDRLTALVGGHAHYNFGFTSNGVHEVSLQVVARIAGREDPFLGRTNRIQFQVEPLPAVVETPWSRWIADQFGADAAASMTDPAADPDGDGLVNLHEFLTGTSPRDAASRFPMRIFRDPSDGRLQLRVPVVADRLESVVVVVEQASAVEGPWSTAGTPAPSLAGTELEFNLPEPTDEVVRFLRLRTQLR